MRTIAKSLAIAVAPLIPLFGCSSPGGNVQEKRQAVHDMRTKTLNDLYRLEPNARVQVRTSVGYGVFSNVGVYLIFASAGGGWGVVRNNQSGRDTYMKMGSLGLGLGLGVKDFRGVFVFTTESALDQFVNKGWDGSAQADLAAKAGEKGKAFAGAIDVAPGVKLYQITEHGLAIQATVQGTKFWKDEELN